MWYEALFACLIHNNDKKKREFKEVNPAMDGRPSRLGLENVVKCGSFIFYLLLSSFCIHL